MPYLCTAIRKERAITLRFERASNLILTTEFCSKLPSQNSVAFTLKQNDAPKKSLSVRFLRLQQTLPSSRETIEETIHSLTDQITISSFKSYATDRVNSLFPHRTIYSLFMQAKVVSRVALLMPFLFYPLLAVPSSPPTLTDGTGNLTQGVLSHYQCA